MQFCELSLQQFQIRFQYPHTAHYDGAGLFLNMLPDINTTQKKNFMTVAWSGASIKFGWRRCEWAEKDTQRDLDETFYDDTWNSSIPVVCRPAPPSGPLDLRHERLLKER